MSSKMFSKIISKLRVMLIILIIVCSMYSTNGKLLEGNVQLSGKMGKQSVKGEISLGGQKVEINGKLANPIFIETTPIPEKIPTSEPKEVECRDCTVYNLNMEAEWCPITRTINCSGNPHFCSVQSTYVKTRGDKYVPYYFRGCATYDACEMLHKDSVKGNAILPYACTLCTTDMCNNAPFIPVPALN